jgi:hypothetical protein
MYNKREHSMPFIPVHIIWGEEAVRRYRLGIIDNVVRLAHAHYDFEHALEVRGFLRGIGEARPQEEWALVRNLPDINKLGPPLRTRLLQAIREGNVLLVEELVDIGVSLESKDAHGMTPLHWAAREGQARIAEILVDHQAPLDAVAEGAHEQTPLIMACESPREGAKDVAVLLLQRGANPDVQDSKGNTAMHHVSRTAEAEVLEALVNAEANPNIKNNEGMSPLDIVGLIYGHDEKAHIHHIMETARLAAAERQKSVDAALRRPRPRPTPFNTRD